MKKSTNIDMTMGKPFKLITLFTLPALASNLLNQVYTITDSIIVGRFLGQTSLAAVGVCMPVILLVSSMVIGLNIGIGILMSYGFGSKDYKVIRHTLANAIYMGIFLGVVIAIFGVMITEPVLRLMGTQLVLWPKLLHICALHLLRQYSQFITLCLLMSLEVLGILIHLYIV